MNSKILAIIVCTLLISTAVSVIGELNDTEKNETDNVQLSHDHDSPPCRDCEGDASVRGPRVKEWRVPIRRDVEPPENTVVSRGVIYVDDDAPSGWYDATHVRTIQEGVDNATEGDTVYVYTGSYAENVLVYKAVDLVGESRDNVIVDGTFTSDTLYVTANAVSVSNFTINNGVDGIVLDTVSDCVITNCLVEYSVYDGIWLYMSSYVTITGCEVSYNGYEGIDLFPANDCVIADCFGTENSDGMCLYSDYGFYCDNNTVTGCSFDHSWWAGVWLSEASHNVFST